MNDPTMQMSVLKMNGTVDKDMFRPKGKLIYDKITK